jgi:ribonuclease HII
MPHPLFPMHKQIRCGTRFERDGRRAGYRFIAGVDEVGRGALFGPVLAAAVILDPTRPIPGIRDSKQLSPSVRETLACEIRRSAFSWAVGSVEAAEIDRINIYQASRLAMKESVLRLDPSPDLLLVDALHLDLDIPQISIIRGDSLSVSVAAASILAKVARDLLMRQWDRVFPQYGLARHKGYPTPAHKSILQQLGPTPLHRRSYAPVRNAVGTGLPPDPERTEELRNLRQGDLLDGYRAMTLDTEREAEAQERCEGLITDADNQEE